VLGTARFLVAWDLPGALHMAWDALLLDEAERSARPAVLRVASWSPAAVSLGRFQDAGRAIDCARARAAGYDVVRRPTGGRVVLHEGDVTYGLVARHDDPVFGGSRAASLRAIGAALADALARLGVSAGLARGAAGRWSRAGEAPPCFATASRDELQSGGRKLLGSARLEGRHAFLQQGSLPVREIHAALAQILPGGDGARARTEAELDGAATCLHAAAGRAIARDEIARALQAAFSAAAGRRFRIAAPTARERRAAHDRAAAFAIAPAPARAAALAPAPALGRAAAAAASAR
jgi:lipoate-protein ligase A